MTCPKSRWLGLSRPRWILLSPPGALPGPSRCQGGRRVPGGGRRHRIGAVSDSAALLDGFCRGAFALVVGPTASVVTGLGNGHDVQAMIELAIAGARQPVADDVTGGGLDRGGTGVGGKRRS